MVHKVKEIVKGFYLLRIDDVDTKYFEALWDIPEGITYNSYVLLTDEGAVVFDAWKAAYADEFVEAVREVTPLRRVKYVVAHHGEPDHSGSIPALTKAVGDAGGGVTLLGHPMVGRMLKSMYGLHTPFKPVSDGEEVAVGGITLKFLHTPWLHWPETIMTYLPDLGVLVSCDAFGSYSIPPCLTDEGCREDVLREYEGFVRKYFTTVIGRFRKHVVRALGKLEAAGISPSTIAPSHGIVWVRDPGRIAGLYRRLAEGAVEEGKVVAIYSSMYGFVESAVDYVVRELEGRGFSVKVFAFTDSEQARVSEVLGEVEDAEAVVVGVSTYEAGAFPTLEHVLKLISVKAPGRGRPALILGAYGWGASGGRVAKQVLEAGGYGVVGPIEFSGRLTDEVRVRLRAGVEELVKAVAGLRAAAGRS